MNSIVVSVVVPVYNVAEYLESCLDSLLAQTLEEMEIIIVDDGSTDASPSIVSSYAARHAEKIRVFTKSNGGLSSARNRGIDEAMGEYIGFVDGDDVVDPAMFGMLVEAARSGEADVVICGLDSWDPDTGQRYVYGSARASEFGTTLERAQGQLWKISPSACNKLYRRSVFDDSELRFPEGMLFEDLAIIFRVLARADRVGLIEPVLYHYRIRAGSIMADRTHGFLDLPKAYRMLVEGLESDGSLDQLREEIQKVGVLHLFIGRFADFFPFAPAGVRAAYIDSAYGALEHELRDWRTLVKQSAVWPSPFCRTIVRHRWLLTAYTALPARIQMYLSRQLRLFADPGE